MAFVFMGGFVVALVALIQTARQQEATLQVPRAPKPHFDCFQCKNTRAIQLYLPSGLRCGHGTRPNLFVRAASAQSRVVVRALAALVDVQTCRRAAMTLRTSPCNCAGG